MWDDLKLAYSIEKQYRNLPRLGLRIPSDTGIRN
jgi:hypothetical protein